VVREVLSDLDTPLSVYLKLADGPHTYLFESVEGGERFGRHSIIGLPARRVYEFRGHTLEVREYGEVVETREVEDPLAEVELLRAAHKVPKLDGLPGFAGGLVGWFGFECIEYIEPRLRANAKPDELGTPDILLMLSDELAVFDNLKGRLYLIVHADPREPQAWARANRRLDALSHRLRHGGAPYPETLVPAAIDESDFRLQLHPRGYHRRGAQGAGIHPRRRHLPGGSKPAPERAVPARPVDVYRALRALNPSPYMYFLDTGSTQVVGSSPEILARLQQMRTARVRSPCARSPARVRAARPSRKTRRWKTELLADPKERAEHLMLIDLGRNDVGRVSEAGSVQVGEQFVIERYSHVMHIVSEVTGTLKPGLGYADVLRATFPAGTVSGAPKIRALEVIRELEPVKRNVYSGAVGYIGWHGDADTAIAIRTAVIQDGRCTCRPAAASSTTPIRMRSGWRP
jgi:anthranilate synthase component 1